MKTSRILIALICSEIVFSAFWFLFPSTLDPILPAAYSILRGHVTSYPALGYPALFIPAVVFGINPMWWIFYLQLILCLAGVWLFFTEFEVNIHWGTVFGLLPFVAVMALKQTAAVPCALVIVAVVLMRHRKVWAAAVVLALCALFRTELLLLLPCLAFGLRRTREAYGMLI